MSISAPSRRAPRRGLRGLLTALVATGLVVVGPSGASLADPTPPSAQDVLDAQQTVTDAARSVATMEVRLAELAAVADDAEVAVQQAGEAYSRALDAADTARTTADEAAVRAQGAATAADRARADLMSFARQMARSGGTNDTVEALLSADGFEDVAQRSTELVRLTGKADDTVQRFRAARLVADTLQGRADGSALAATDAESDARGALEVAQSTEIATQAGLDGAALERDGLIVRLAAAQNTSTEVEQARQDGLDAQRRARQVAAVLTPRGSPAVGSSTSTATGETTSGGTTSGSTTPGSTAAGGAVAAPTTPGGTTTAPTTPGGPASGGAPTPGTPSADAPTGDAPTGGTSPGTASTPYGLGTGASRGSAEAGRAAVAWASAQVGKAYVYGAAGPDSFDCSGLTTMAWRSAGVHLNRSSRDQYMGVLKIGYDDLRPGDLVFWSTDPANPSAVYHVAMWVGDGQIVEASRPGVPLRVTTMRWGATMPYAGRP